MKKIFILCLCTFAFNSFATDVGLTWYDGNSTISGASSCTVGGTFVPPTPPSRTGYIFAGWRVKEIHIPCGQQIQNLDTSTNGSNLGYARLNGNAGENESNYGLTTGSGQWATEFSYGTVWGMANCNNTNGTYAVADTPTLASSGKYCWCQVTGFTASGNSYTSGPQCTTDASSLWVFARNTNKSSTCAANCMYNCTFYVLDSAAFRAAVFGAVGQ